MLPTGPDEKSLSAPRLLTWEMLVATHSVIQKTLESFMLSLVHLQYDFLVSFVTCYATWI